MEKTLQLRDKNFQNSLTKTFSFQLCVLRIGFKTLFIQNYSSPKLQIPPLIIINTIIPFPLSPFLIDLEDKHPQPQPIPNHQQYDWRIQLMQLYWLHGALVHFPLKVWQSQGRQRVVHELLGEGHLGQGHLHADDVFGGGVVFLKGVGHHGGEGGFFGKVEISMHL